MNEVLKKKTYRVRVGVNHYLGGLKESGFKLISEV